MRTLLTRIAVALGAVLVSGSVVTGTATGEAAPAVPGGKTTFCANSYDCLLDFVWPQDAAGNPMDIAFDVDANGGVEQPVAVSVDFTSNPHCGVTIGVAQPAGSWICPVAANMGGGGYRLYVYAGDRHDYSLGVRWG